MGETNWLQFVKPERSPREGGEDMEGLEGIYPGQSDPADSEGTWHPQLPLSHSMAHSTKVLAKC